jgi:hypothetical protein
MAVVCLQVYTEDCSNLLERIMAGTDGPAKANIAKYNVQDDDI